MKFNHISRCKFAEFVWDQEDMGHLQCPFLQHLFPSVTDLEGIMSPSSVQKAHRSSLYLLRTGSLSVGYTDNCKLDSLPGVFFFPYRLGVF